MRVFRSMNSSFSRYRCSVPLLDDVNRRAMYHWKPMFSTEHQPDQPKYGMHVLRGDHYRGVLERLIAALEPYQHNDQELRQLYLETHWLLSNYDSGVLLLPKSWELIIFQLLRQHKLRGKRDVQS